MKYLILILTIFFLGCQDDETEKNISASSETTTKQEIKVRTSSDIDVNHRALIRKNFQKYKTEKRTALVIGNGKYPEEFSLKNPINDSRAIRDALKKVGFEVIYGEDLTKDKFLELLDNFQDRLIKNGGVSLFYYAGHGMEIDGINYLVPIDAKFNELKKIKYYSISLNDVLGRMNDTITRLKIVILDACRNDPTKNRNITFKGFTNPPQAEGTFIAYATSAGSVAEDGDDGHGTFTKHLLKYLTVKGLDLYSVFKKTTLDVLKETNKQQFPAVYDQTSGYFYFLLPKLEDLKKQDISKPKLKIVNLDETSDKKENSEITVNEEPNEFAKIKIFVYPTDAEILIDNKKYNPDKLYRRGQHQISISAQGYETKNFELNLDQSKIIDIVLKRNWFKLSVITNPLDSKIEFVNLNKSYHKGILLKNGKYQLKISAKNHETKTVDIDLNEDLVLNVKLKQVKFSLQINTTPKNAEINFVSGIKYYDGIYLKAGNYKIRVSARGYKTKTINLKLKSNTALNIDLTKTNDKNINGEIYSWTGEKIRDFNLPEYKYPKATFQEFLEQVKKRLISERIKEFHFNKVLAPKDEFETTAQFEQRKLNYQFELEQAKIKYQHEKNRKIKAINQELKKNSSKLFCYWLNLGKTQKFELQYNSDLQYFSTKVLINNIPAQFNFPVPLKYAKRFKQRVKFIKLNFQIQDNNIFITKAYANLWRRIFSTKLNLEVKFNFKYEKSKLQLEKLTGKS